MVDRHLAAKSLLFVEFCKKFPVLWLISRRDRFAYDCAHHHPVSANRTFPIRGQIGPFCGDFRPALSRILSLRAFAHFGCGFWRFVSASKNSVPGGRSSARNPTAVEAAVRALHRSN